jgi:hypothetical protein
MRNEFSAFPLMVAAPGHERDWLRMHLHPPWHGWQIWAGRYLGSKTQHWAAHLPMHVDSSITSETGPDKVNTQTTTLVIGQMYAHLFSSTVIGEEFGYRGIHLTRFWPPSGYPIHWGDLPIYGDAPLLSLAGALSRDIPSGP